MATQNSTEPTWTPVIHYKDGRTISLANGMTHSAALAAAEQVACNDPEVEYTGTTRN